MPKPSGLMNDREMLICSRVCNVRVRAGFSQTVFAKILGITRNLAASLEYARTPVRYWLGNKLCQRFNICQLWFATGEAPRDGYVGIPLEIEAEIAPGELFSAIYDRRVGHFVKSEVRETQALARAIMAQASGAEKLLQDRLYNLARCWFQRIPPELYDKFFGELMAASSRFFQEHRYQFGTGTWPPRTISGGASEAGATGKSKVGVDIASGSANIADMNSGSAWKALVEDLRVATTARGAKTELARAMGVTRQAVNNWLSNKCAPSAELTLRLLQWVQRAEASPKQNPGGAPARPGQKTRVDKTKAYEKGNSNTRKK